jgi:hypothetical protein
MQSVTVTTTTTTTEVGPEDQSLDMQCVSDTQGTTLRVCCVHKNNWKSLWIFGRFVFDLWTISFERRRIKAEV